MKKYPTQKELQRLFTYKNGKLIRRIAPSRNVKVGDIVGTCSYGYREVKVNKVLLPVHRLIWIYVYGSIDPTLEIDHINGIRDDNRIENLRLVTTQQNQFNQTKAKGYCWDTERKKWRAGITKDQKQINLGRYDTEEEAHKAYLEAKKKYHKISTPIGSPTFPVSYTSLAG